MAVYVDELFATNSPHYQSKCWHYKLACHLFADNISELMEFAIKLGLKLKWFQDNPALPHFDITKNKRLQAVKLGAIEVDRNKVHEMMKKNRSLK